MKSSKNPKVLNYIIRNTLDPVFQRLEALKIKEAEYRAFLAGAERQADAGMKSVYENLEKYRGQDEAVRHLLESSNALLTDMIRARLYNPNIMDEEGSGGQAAADTLLLSDKSLASLCYGFVKEGAGILLAGIINKGIAAGNGENASGEYEFLNPFNNGFPSFYPNDILKLSQTSAFIATNNGLVEFDIAAGSYRVRTTSHGLNSNVVKRILPLSGSPGERTGYLAGTDRGICFSPNGVRWVNVDKKFARIVTSFHSTQKLNENYNKIFIGTNRGLYYFDASSYIENPDGEGQVKCLNGISEILPGYYINSVAYNTEKDILYIVTDGGTAVIKEPAPYAGEGNLDGSPARYELFDSRNGLSGTMCSDIALMPNHKAFIATANGVTVTSDFTAFSYVTKKVPGSQNLGLNSYMCCKLVRKNNSVLTVIHPVGFTEGLYA
jgi:ligand-binding sensor domain-containing protein